MTKVYSEIKRFILVGGLATSIHVLCATYLIGIINVAATSANCIAFGLAYILSYTLHSKWSFSSHLNIHIFVKYTMVAILNIALIRLLVALNETLEFENLYSVLFVVIINPLFNFSALKLWVYRKKHK